MLMRLIGKCGAIFSVLLAVNAMAENPVISVTADSYPAIPEMVTSFGAAATKEAVYIYGGHTGGAHQYCSESQAKTLWRLKLDSPRRWESLGDGPGLQGLAMVTHDGKLYRIGGFTAKNKAGEDADLWSQAKVSVYDPATKNWTDLHPLPEPRSSFDAAVVGDKIYVVGGWSMQGDDESKWHESAYVLDLDQPKAQWEKLPNPPFQRRALSLAAHDGKLYVLGGMQPNGKVSTRVDVFDPETQKWTRGPNLQGEQMDGFGSSAFAVGGRLYASTYSGLLQRLSSDGNSWEVVKELERDRFFHRLLPISGQELMVIGGASMSSGKFSKVESILIK